MNIEGFHLPIHTPLKPVGMFITRDMRGSVKLLLDSHTSFQTPVRPSNQKEDKKAVKDKSQFSILPPSPLPHTARLDQYLIFSRRR